MVRDPTTGQVPPRAALRAHAGLLAQMRASADVAIECADLGRAPRAGVSSIGRHGQGHRARQPGRRRAHAGHLRSRAQSALSRRPRPLRRRRPAVPRGRSRSQRESRSRRRPRAEDAVEGPALRDDRGGAGVFGSLGSALGRYAHPRHDEAPGRRDVCRGTAGARPAPVEPFRYYRFGDRTVHLNGCVEVEGAYYGAPPGWLGQRVQVQWNDLHVRLLSPEDRPAAAGASAHAPRLVSDPRRGPPRADAAHDAGAAGARDLGRPAHRHRVHAHPPARRRAGRPPHPRRPRAREKTRRRPSSRTPPKPRSRSACRPIASCGSTSNAARPCP